MNRTRTWVLLAATFAASALSTPGLAQDTDVEELKRELERLRSRVEQLEREVAEKEAGDEGGAPLPASDIRVDVLERRLEILEDPGRAYDLERRRRLEQFGTEDGTIVAGPAEDELQVDIGGALWINFAHQDWVGDDDGRRDDLRFDNLRLSVDSTYNNFVMSAQYRFYSFTRALHHAWIGYEFDEGNEVQLGVSQVPFGLLPFGSHNFWFLIPYFVGLEDDYDAGIKWHNELDDHWTLDLAFYLNEEYSDPTDLDRYSVDVVRDGEQQNDERNQFNARLAYDWKHGRNSHTEFGISGRYGDLDNRTTQKTGDYWAAAVHMNAFWGPWNVMLEGIRYEYDPENPEGVSGDLVLMGNLGSKRLIAAEADILVANVAYDFGAVGGPIEQLNCYNDYSYMDKNESRFQDSQINDLGCLVAMGPFWVWIDYIWGKNAWYLNDSEAMSGFGEGGTDDWEQRFNVNFEWYF